ncbi:MAG: hypothetical protein M1823_005150 [Watsoniomyces obsoletus]|nr:MAG: hypothetical protein M1823_005150 [Watsoniomyces obsoletus]
MRAKLLHRLKRTKIRQSWNKYNLYNLSQLPRNPVDYSGTFFQQKWKSKSLTRAYHGEQIKEKQWHRLFRPRLAAVVPMDHVPLARSDGSEHGAGRGSGVQSRRPKKLVPQTPYMHMLYAPAERRLDTAIFRALFASSIRQARQFVVHGSVKVNGKKMIYPGYLLNPGDMFQVEPERVLYATGARKDRYDRHAGRRLRRQIEGKTSPSEEAESPLEEKQDEEAPSESTKSDQPAEEKPITKPKVQLSTLLGRARAVLASKGDFSAKRKQDLRSFTRDVRTALSRGSKVTTTDLASLDGQLSEILTKIGENAPSKENSPATAATETPLSEEEEVMQSLSASDRRALQLALQEARDNPIDPTKPYATPWRPRPFMSPFAFIPRFLEVHQSICSAVYLRHPVARPGASEVPSPFSRGEHQLAFNWYLRRR